MFSKIILVLLLVSFAFSTNLIITPENSPFIIDSVLVIDTLIVKENSQVFFKSGSGLKIEKLLYSVGSTTAPISFSSAEHSPSNFDWNGIIISSDATGYLINTKLANCITCVNSFTTNLIIDSTKIYDFGENAMLINDSVVEAVSETKIFQVNPDQWPLMAIDLDNIGSKKWVIYAVAGAAVIGSGLTYFLLSGDDPKKEEPIPETNDINYPNLPNK